MNIIRNEFKGWKLWEISWLIAACAIITGLSIYWGDNLMGIISATTGVACVVCTGKGKLSAYIFGVINCALYAIISYKAALYGETILNAVYYLPMQFYGFYVWHKNMDNETHEVNKRHMNNKTRILYLLAIIVTTLGFAAFLKHIGDAMPLIDSFTTVASVFAMIISIRMYSEQWWLWIFVDVCSVIMWANAYINGNDSMATLLMWIVYLGNAIIMCVKWEKEVNRNKKEA
jgi:nicotinamide mononucleotide transporter